MHLEQDLKKYTDWYLRVGFVNGSHACLISDTGRPERVRASTSNEVLFIAQSLLDACHTHLATEDFRMDVLGIHFRGHIIHSVSGDIVDLRRMPDNVLSPDDLGFNELVMQSISSSRLRNGLLLVGGAQGAGKSTTLSSILKYRLENFGGHAITVEDPIEMPLDGWHGDGVCIQTQIDSHSSFIDGVRGAMRSYPVGQHGLLMLGEIRDTETAVEACNASTNGLLVLATIHANGPLDIFQRLENLARAGMPTEEVRSNIASGFRMLIHQELIRGSIHQQVLINGNAVKTHLQTGKYSMLSTELQGQNRRRVT